MAVPLRLNETSAAPTRVRHGVLAFTLVLTAIAYLDRVCISTAAPAMKGELGISDVEMGYVFSAFTLAYALLEVPSGWLADRFGARLMLARIVVWWSAMTAATGLVSGFASLLAVRFLFGVGEAGLFPSMSRAYAHWLPARERGRTFGLALMTAALGGAAPQPRV
jgi:MFS family permease